MNYDKINKVDLLKYIISYLCNVLFVLNNLIFFLIIIN